MQAVVEGTAARRVRGARELVGLPVRPGGCRPAGRWQAGGQVGSWWLLCMGGNAKPMAIAKDVTPQTNNSNCIDKSP